MKAVGSVHLDAAMVAGIADVVMDALVEVALVEVALAEVAK